MSDRMRVIAFDRLLRWILREYEENESILGIHRSLFYHPSDDSPYGTDDLYGQYLAAPIGPAAGPHTQLAQNIVCAWLSGGRFIELKTVQVMDELEIPRPCIDVADEGYNVEWSQELKLEQSAGEYIKAWALIHVLRRKLGYKGTRFGTVFNMSVGYDLEGIQSAPMQRFMDSLQDASPEIAEIRGVLRRQFPRYADVEIPAQITNSVTLSTMHGCPPDEIERIARYLLEQRGLHTTVKLNPTLLGREEVLRILHHDLGYREVEIPDAVFEHDLAYDRAVALISALREVACRQRLTFAVKLSNTLAMANHKGVLPGNEMYMSGRALYPVTISLFDRLVHDLESDASAGAGQKLSVSYSAGVDALNVVTVLACGAQTVTVASDLLKPGGYSRMLQYLERLAAEMESRGTSSLQELSGNRLDALAVAARTARRESRYKRDYHPADLPKVASELGLFDCIVAPCVEQCAVLQDVPEYAWLIARGDVDGALEVILARNPLPGVTGHVCTHLCQTRCTRHNYDQAVAIRALKRHAAERGQAQLRDRAGATGHRVAIVGSGPSGLAAAYHLALSGVQVTILEARDRPGGMLAIAPAFRLPPEVVDADVTRILDLGVDLELSHPVEHPPEDLLESGYDAVYLACGFAKDARLEIEGLEAEGVFSALDLLERVAWGGVPELGQSVLVIGGGNTAMDAARTAQRLTGRPVTVVYRRTREQMPAEEDELEDLLAERNELVELASPRRALVRDGHVVGLECIRNELGAPDETGRRRPVPVEDSAFVVEADAIIVAIGQRPDLAFLDGSTVSLGVDGAIPIDCETGQTCREGVYAGGDVTRGPATIVDACADGRRAAQAICAQLGVAPWVPDVRLPVLSAEDVLRVKRARAQKELQHRPNTLPVAERAAFDLVEQTLTEEAARCEAARCLQCSTLCAKCVEVCPNRANYVYGVAPVSWSVPQLACRDGKVRVVGHEPFEVRQTRQILHLDDLCNECGNCATFCVHEGKPYVDKPRLFFEWDDFRQESDNAYYVEGKAIWRRESGRTVQLRVQDDTLWYEDTHVSVCLSSTLEARQVTLKEPFRGSRSLRPAAEMAVILEGVGSMLPFLATGRREPTPGEAQ